MAENRRPGAANPTNIEIPLKGVQLNTEIGMVGPHWSNQDPDGLDATGGQRPRDGLNRGVIRDAIVSRFGKQISGSPTLLAVIEQGSRYVQVDPRSAQIVFDVRAMFLGFWTAGQPAYGSANSDNTAVWFVEWIGTRRSSPRLSFAPSDAELGEAWLSGVPIILSQSVNAIIALARKYAIATSGRKQIAARHVLAALVREGRLEDFAQSTLGFSLTADEVVLFDQFLVGKIMEAPHPGETAENWFRALARPSPQPEGNSKVDVSERVAPFDSDRPSGAVDFLGIAKDARALARLICLDQAAPLAIAILGDWGAGKSTFMDHIDAEVREIASGPTGTDASHEVALVSRVVQIRFNAWQFVDANLWVSLAAEFFDQLRAGGWERAGGERYDGLVARVNSHVHSLNTDVEAKRLVAGQGERQVAEAQKTRDAAAKLAKGEGARSLSQSGIDLLADIYRTEKSTLRRIGYDLGTDDITVSIDAIVDAARAGSDILAKLGVVLKILTKTPTRMVVAVIALVVFLAASIALLFAIARIGPAIIVSYIVSLGALAGALAPIFSWVGTVAERGAEIATRFDKDSDAALKTLLIAEIQLGQAVSEASARQRVADEAQRSLSRYVDPEGGANPPRLLRFILEDDPDTKALKAELGLLSRTRRLFQAVDDIVRTERTKPTHEPDDPDVPDRIVLYIDDLDRCTESQVYEVLQAVHLLLAFELFVVVVGVDVGVIEQALKSKLVAGEAELSDNRASRYLEKIFQVAFWLEPLSTTGDGAGTYADYLRALTYRSAPSPAVRAGGPAPYGKGSFGSGTMGSEGSRHPESAADVGQREILRAVELEQIEIDFLASPSIAAIAAKTPRTIKRMLNFYRLVRARLSEDGADVLGRLGSKPDYPLIALCVAIETGQANVVADSFYNGLQNTPAGQSLAQIFSAYDDEDSNVAAESFARAGRACPELENTFEAILTLRGRELSAGELLRVARVARRFSFNRYS